MMQRKELGLEEETTNHVAIQKKRNYGAGKVQDPKKKVKR